MEISKVKLTNNDMLEVTMYIIFFLLLMFRGATASVLPVIQGALCPSQHLDMPQRLVGPRF
jgi:hypothetical protein